MSVEHPQTILITGASSGIGRALALAYAGHGVTLFLSGRDKERVDGVTADCRARGAEAYGKVLNVTDANAMRDWVEECDKDSALDLIIANAGVSNSTSGTQDEDARTRRLFAINVDGVVNTVLPALACFRNRGRGQLALMASIAGFRGLPSSPAYSASKAAVKNWGEALRGELLDTDIRVNVICPGWVESRITRANRFPMPMLMDAGKAASIVKRGLAADKARIVFPWPMHFAVWLLGALPPAWTDRALSRAVKGKEW